MKTIALAAAFAAALAVTLVSGDANAADFATQLFERLGRNG